MYVSLHPCMPYSINILFRVRFDLGVSPIICLILRVYHFVCVPLSVCIPLPVCPNFHFNISLRVCVSHSICIPLYMYAIRYVSHFIYFIPCIPLRVYSTPCVFHSVCVPLCVSHFVFIPLRVYPILCLSHSMYIQLHLYSTP